MEQQTQGIDVSEWQGEINFQDIKKDGVSIVYIRAGQGDNYIDKYFETNYKNAKAAGLNIGFYFYVTATNESEARQQASFFYSLIEEKEFECRAVMDFEEFKGLSRVEINEIGIAFMEQLQKLTGIVPAIYTDVSNVKSIWNDSFVSYPLWIAEYDGKESPKSIGQWNNWSGYQYTDQGSVNGIYGFVDRDYFGKEMFCATELEEIKPIKKEPTFSDRYTVRAGDTLYQIASEYHTTISKLASLNHIKNVNQIYVGEVLQIQ